MRDIPLSVIFAFPPGNYVNPHTRGPGLMIVNSIFLVLCTIFMSLRMYTRIWIVRTFGWDDASLLLGFIFAVGLAANVMLANNVYYWDRHIWDIPLTAAASLGKAAMSAKVLFTASVTFIRYALLLFYFRLVNDTGMRNFKWALHGTIWFNFAIFVVLTFLSIFQCRPISAYWKLGESDKCLDEGVVTLSTGIVNCIADILVTALPLPIILKLHMPLAQRLGVVFLLSMGFIVTTAGFVRTYFIWKALIDSYDETWFAYPLWISAAVEVQLGIITACIPPLRPLFAMYFPGFSNPIIKITDKLSSVLSGSKDSTPAHSANQTKPLSVLDATVMSEAEPYHPIDVEKLQSQKHVSLTSSRKTPKRLSWQMLRQKSIEVKRDTLPSVVTVGTPRIKSWPKSPGLSSTTTANNKSPKGKRLSKVFTHWFGTSSGSSPGSASFITDNATSRGLLSPQLQQHPLRHESEPPINNSSKPIQRPNTASAQNPAHNLIWPLREPTTEQVAADVNPRRTISDGAYHRVEIRGNPFVTTADVAKTPEGNDTSDDRGQSDAKSRATTMTTHWA